MDCFEIAVAFQIARILGSDWMWGGEGAEVAVVAVVVVMAVVAVGVRWGFGPKMDVFHHLLFEGFPNILWEWEFLFKASQQVAI